MSHNQVGKKRVTCSCGTKAALDDYEIQVWLNSHSALAPSIKHELKIGAPIGPDEFW